MNTEYAALREKIKARSKAMIRARKKRIDRILSVCTCAVFLTLLGVFSGISRSESIGLADGVYGSLVITPDAGGYIFVGVICFLAGVFLTLLGIRYRKKRGGKS